MSDKVDDILDRFEKCECLGKDEMRDRIRNDIHIALMRLDMMIEGVVTVEFWAEDSSEKRDKLVAQLHKHTDAAKEHIKASLLGVGL